MHFSKLILTIFLFTLLFGCIEEDKNSHELISMTAHLDESSLTSTAYNYVSTSKNYSNISRVILEAKSIDEKTHNISIELQENNGIFSGSLDLFDQQTYQFTAKAYIDYDVEFLGVTQQLASPNTNIKLNLNNVNSIENSTIPYISSIEIPDFIEQGTASNIAFQLNGSSGDLLKYEIIGESNFFEISMGYVNLESDSSVVNLVSKFNAPKQNDTEHFFYSIKITNSQNISSEYPFKITVSPTLVNNNVTLIFNPTIHSVNIHREGDSLIWTANAEGISGNENLSYQWKFNGDPISPIDYANPGVMSNYNENISGTITLTVTDKNLNGGQTHYNINLYPNAFPKDIVTTPEEQERIVLDFSGLSLANGQTCQEGQFSEKGYTFIPSKDCSLAISHDSETNNTWLQVMNNGRGSYLHQPNDVKFTLYQLDIAETQALKNIPTTIRVICIKTDTSEVIHLDLDGVINDQSDMFQKFLLEDRCTNIHRFWFEYGTAVDNIVVSKPVQN
jgi:hypothetical protein